MHSGLEYDIVYYLGTPAHNTGCAVVFHEHPGHERDLHLAGVLEWRGVGQHLEHAQREGVHVHLSGMEVRWNDVSHAGGTLKFETLKQQY